MEVNSVLQEPALISKLALSDIPMTVVALRNGELLFHDRRKLNSFSLKLHQGPIHRVKYSKNGLRLITAGADSTVKVLSGQFPRDYQKIQSHKGPVRGLDISQNNRLFASAGDDKTVKLYRLADLKFLWSAMEHKHWVRCCCFSLDSKLLATGGEDSQLSVLDVQKKKKLFKSSDFGGEVRDVLFASKDMLIASSGENRIRVFDTRTSILVQLYDAHKDIINGISFLQSKQYLMSCSLDGTSKIWDFRQGILNLEMLSHGSAVSCCQLGQNRALTGGHDKNIHFWRLDLQ